MLVSHRRKGGNTAQLYRLTEPMGQLEQLTFTPDPVSSAEYEPRDGATSSLVWATGGNEGGAAVPAGARHAERPSRCC